MVPLRERGTSQGGTHRVFQSTGEILLLKLQNGHRRRLYFFPANPLFVYEYMYVSLPHTHILFLSLSFVCIYIPLYTASKNNFSCYPGPWTHLPKPLLPGTLTLCRALIRDPCLRLSACYRRLPDPIKHDDQRRPNMISFVLYTRGPQPLGRRPVPVHGPLGTRSHSRR